MADRNIADLVRAVTDAMTSDNIEKVIPLFADDAGWTIMATGESFRGHDRIRMLAERAVASRAHTDELGIHPRNVFTNAEGTRMCWEYLHTGIAKREGWTQDRPREGLRLDEPIVLVCDIDDGKIVALREYLDLLSVLEPDRSHRIYT
jgi:ketosteroid isomerase-like protein